MQIWMVCRSRLLVILAGLLLWNSTAPAAPASLKPDLLLLMPDQMRGDCLSILGHSGVRTPHFDALAKAGALFRRAYTTVPSCIPARHALLTGLYPQTNRPSPAHGDWVDWTALSPQGDKPGHRILLAGEILGAAQAGYYGLIQHLDAQVAPLIEEFKQRSEHAGRPWVILLTSDHGEMLGDHGYFRKCEPYEGSANIPLIITGSPELGFQSGQRNLQPVCLEDLMPTLLALAGAQPPALHDGINLVPVLRGATRVPRAWLHFEHAPCYSQQQAFHALTDGRFKYIWRPLDGTEQWFDLEADPREEHDLAAHKTVPHQTTYWRVQLAKRLASRPEGFSQGTNLIPGRPYPPLSPRMGE